MWAKRVYCWVGVALMGLCLTLVAGCDEQRRTEQQQDACRSVDSPEGQRICRSFASTLEKEPEATKGAKHLVFRSFCDGKTERAAVEIDESKSGQDKTGSINEALARLVTHRFSLGEPSGECVYTAELLRPRGDQTAWAAVDSLDEYRAYRNALSIEGDPSEVVTPLDFTVVRPAESTESLAALPHVYRHQARDADYLAVDTPVRVHDVGGFVLRDGQVEPFRYHRVRHEKVDQETLTDGVRRAANWFASMRDERRGRFYYEYNPYNDTYVDERYNLLRHAGTSWSIMQAYGLTGDEEIRRLGEEALAWVLEQSRTEKRDGRTIRYVVESWNNKAKLGGAGLWLLALSEHARLTGDTSNLELIQQIANHIYLAQDPETGKFESFHQAPGLRVTDHESDYYPGEAMFALHRARPFLEDVPVCEITKKGLEYMLHDEPRQMPALRYRFVNQWNAYAIREYRRDCNDKRFDWVWRRDLEHMLATAATPGDDPVMAGAYQARNGDFSTSPTRLEALTTICTELGAEDANVARRCEPVVRRVAGMQLSFQHSPSNSWVWANPKAVDGGFARELDRETIRIDFTQHHLSAMYNAIDFLRHVSARQNADSNKTASNTARSFPFNLVGEATCQAIEEVKCL